MYPVVLVLHSWVRWIVVVAGFLVVARSLRARRKAWMPADARLGAAFVAALDVQLLFGLVLYVALSPITTVAVHQLGAAMHSRVLRFWTVEHPLLMLSAVVLAHVGQVRARRAGDAARKHYAGALFFGLALILVLAGIPWPFLPYGRPLLALH
jgi:hypothetical protein